MSEHFETPPEQVDDFDFERRITDVARTVVAKLVAARRDYGESWVKRGGTGAYMVAMRKFDRLEQALPAHGYDIFAALRADQRAEGVADDMQDLVAYLLLWIEYADRLGLWPKPIQRGVTDTRPLSTVAAELVPHLSADAVSQRLTDLAVAMTPPPAFTPKAIRLPLSGDNAGAEPVLYTGMDVRYPVVEESVTGYLRMPGDTRKVGDPAPAGTPVIGPFQPRPRVGDDPHDAEETTHG